MDAKKTIAVLVVALIGGTGALTAGEVQRDSRRAILPHEGAGFQLFQFVNSDFSLGELGTVKGNPFSADAITEVTQTLEDGNRIVRQNVVAMHRDGEGRTRREHSLDAIGRWAVDAEPQRVVAIHDPVAGETLILEPERRVARRNPVRTLHIRVPDSEDREGTTPEVATVRARSVPVLRAERRRGDRQIHPPHGEPTSVLVYLLCEFTRRRVKVALGGTGGDEIRPAADRHRSPRDRPPVHSGRFVPAG